LFFYITILLNHLVKKQANSWK